MRASRNLEFGLFCEKLYLLKLPTERFSPTLPRDLESDEVTWDSHSSLLLYVPLDASRDLSTSSVPYRGGGSFSLELRRSGM